MKKSQAAMEFLVTYGWAIIASLIVIGALTYFGVSSSGKVLPDKSTFSNNFASSDYVLMPLGGVTSNVLLGVNVVNGAGATVYNPSMSVLLSSGNVVCGMAPLGAWPVDTTKNFTCRLAITASPKDRVKLKLSLTYSKNIAGYNQVAPGEVYVTVASTPGCNGICDPWEKDCDAGCPSDCGTPACY